MLFEEKVTLTLDGVTKKPKQIVAPIYSKVRFRTVKTSDGRFQDLNKHVLESVKDINFRLDHKAYDPIRKEECIPYPGKPQRFTNVCSLYRASSLGHPREDLDGLLTPKIKRLKPCFQLDAFPHSVPNWIHVGFRQYPAIGGEHCKNYVGIEFALSAFNEEGYPTGVAHRSFEFFRYQDVSGPEHCNDEDLLVKYPNKIKLDSSCWYGESVNNRSKFLQSGGVM